MNAVEQIQQEVKTAFRQAVIEAGLGRRNGYTRHYA